MKTQNKNAESFFKDYEKRFNATLQGNKAGINTTAESFTDYFIESSPLGVICGKNDSKFKERMLKGYEFYKKIGITSINILSTEITALDDYHTMAKIYWKTNYEKVK